MADISNGFNDGTRMVDVRTTFLNPTIKKVSEFGAKIEQLENDVSNAYNNVTLKGTVLKMSAPGSGKDIDLAPIIPKAEITVKGGLDTVSHSTGTLEFREASIVGTGPDLEVVYDFDKIVKDNQKFINAKVGNGLAHEIRQVVVTGHTDGITLVDQSLNIDLPVPKKEILGQIGTGTAVPIETVQVTGNTESTSLVGTTLTINIPTGGGGGGVANQNFKGFFESLGDIISEVQDPINGRSYAFAKDAKLGGQFYTPYLYVNNGWTELKQDPSLTYSGPSDPTTHGVFSIKPDSRITIDSSGQIDFSGLATDESKLNFHGFYESQADLETDVPRPVVDKSLAYTKHANGSWIGKVYRHTSSGPGWQIMAPISGISMIASPGSSAIPQTFYGFYKNEMIDVDGNGIATIKGKEVQTIKINVLDSQGDVNTGDVTDLQFMNGESYVKLQGTKAFIQHPQRVMEYDAEFEADHNGNDYMGNVFYDKTSRCWMGWGTPEAPGGVDHKWTRIAHPKMSDEVKDLLKRHPTKAPNVVSGTYGDAPQWEYTSWTYVDKDDSSLPDDFRTRCGAYFSTVIQDIPNDNPRPKERMQICYADETGGHTYIRRWNKDATGQDIGWFPWVRTNLTLKDINDHNTNPDAHKDFHKFYKVYTLNTPYAALKTGQYFIKDKDMMLLADSHGNSNSGEDTISVPYNGTFKFSGRIDFDGWVGTARNTQWLLKVIKVTGSTNTTVAEFSYNHTTVPVSHLPPIKWETAGINLDYGDKIVFFLQSPSDSVFPANYPDLAFIPMRSYFVMEDSTTSSGSRIAETHRKTTGALFSKQSTGVNVHYAAGSAGTIRLYGVPVINEAKVMTKVKSVRRLYE